MQPDDGARAGANEGPDAGARPAVETIDPLLREATARLRDAGSATPRLDAELLLGSVLELDRTRVIAYGDSPVGTGQAARFRELVEARAAGEPVAYLRGLKEFRGLAFAVDRRVLIPRPETELLVDLAEEEVARRLTSVPRAPDAPILAIVDLGTGSGAIAVALAVALRRRGMAKDATILATDVSEDALAVAAENVAAHAVADLVVLRTADLLPAASGAFDLILANPPYVMSAVLPTLPVATSYEPPLALDGGPDGLDVVRRILDLLPAHLAADGAALLEIGGDQGAAIRTAVEDRLPGWSVRIHEDLGGSPRVAWIQRHA